MRTLRARGVSMRIGAAQILHDVDIDVLPGQVLSLVGPNGAGKSTLLSILAGDLTPSEGSVTLDGRDVTEVSPRQLARQRAVLLQKQSLAFGFRVEDVVRMGRAPWHRTERADFDDSVVEQSMKRADVAELAQRFFPTLSGGEQARTAFARLLAQEVPLLMLDEPTAALDLRHQEHLLGVVRTAADEGAAVVVVLHDLSLAAAYSDRICVLSRGGVRADGAPVDVLTPSLLSEVYEHPVHVLHNEGDLVVVPARRSLLEES